MIVLDPREMIRPNLCLVCEMTPDPGSDVVDTLRDLSIGGVPSHAATEAMDLQTHLSGRKYVCSGCIHDLAKTLGWVTPEDVTTLVLTLGAVEEELATIKRHTEPAVLLAQALLRASAEYSESTVSASSGAAAALLGTLGIEIEGDDGADGADGAF